MSFLIAILLLSLCAQPAAATSPDDFARKMQEYGLVDIQSLDSEILIDLKYSSIDNFVGVDMYGEFNEAYLEAEFASKVVRAQKILKQRHPKYTLLIYDAARPISVQRTMRSIVEGTPFEGFVADGTRGGRHNYGVAVDLTIATMDGTPLDMGVGFDDFTDAASVKGTPDNSDPTTRTVEVYRQYINSLCDQGLISRVAAQNRILLIEVMHEAGLYPYRREWWHYEEIISITATREKYQLLDF